MIDLPALNDRVRITPRQTGRVIGFGTEVVSTRTVVQGPQPMVLVELDKGSYLANDDGVFVAVVVCHPHSLEPVT